MNGEFQNNYRDGGHDKSFNDYDRGHHYADNRYLSHQMPTHYADDNRHLQHRTLPRHSSERHLTHQKSKHYAEKRHGPHKMPEDYADKKCLPHQTSEDYAANKCFSYKTPDHNADKRHLLHRTQSHYTDKRYSPYQTSKHYADKRHLPHQTQEDFVDKKCLQHQTIEDFVDERHILHQKPERYAANKCLSHKMPDHYAHKRNLPQQMREPCADKRYLPHQKLKHSADKTRLPHQMPEDYTDKKGLPQQLLENYADKRHLPHEKPKDYADNKGLPHSMPKRYADKRNLPQQMSEVYVDKKYLPHQVPEPNIHTAAPVRCPQSSIVYCKICDVKFGRSNFGQHNNGKKHQMLLALRELSMKHKSSNGQQSRQIPNSSQVNPIVQPRKVSKSMKIGHLVESVNCEAPSIRDNRVPAEGSKRKVGDNTGAKGCGLKGENVSHEAPSFKHKNVPAERSKRILKDSTDAKDHGFKHEIGGATGGKYLKMNNGIRRPMKSSKPDVKALSNSVKSQVPELTPTSGHLASPKIAPNPVKGSSFKAQSQHISGSLTQKSKGKEHLKFQNTTVKKNDQPHSTPEELNASTGSNRTESVRCDFAEAPVSTLILTPSSAVGSSFEPPIQIDSQLEIEGKGNHEVQNCGVETNDQLHSISRGSDINTLIKDSCSDSGATVIAPPQSPIDAQLSAPVAVNQTETSESKVPTEIQNHIVHSNDQQPPISMELQDPAGSMTNNQTEVVNSNSAATGTVLEPLSSAPPSASVSSFEPQTEHLLHTEMEPQESDAVAYYQSQHPTEKTDIELLPKLLMEIDAASEISAETETADESSQEEVEMDVLADELGVIQFPQVSVCLKCGNEGFEEALVYCNKCEYYALHRYCLDGPVIFTDEVIWFCEDCESDVVDVDYPDSEFADSENVEVDSNEDYDQGTTDSEKGEVDSRYGCSTVVDPLPVADPVWRGSLQLINRSFELMSHLSTLACPKVLEETRHLPRVLNADLLQRSAVWPQSFRKYGTNNQSIGLYFFPENERIERYFDELVCEMISNDLAIRAKVEEAELLIFSSTMLPSQYRRFQSKYYLWGIFRRKQTSS